MHKIWFICHDYENKNNQKQYEKRKQILYIDHSMLVIKLQIIILKGHHNTAIYNIFELKKRRKNKTKFVSLSNRNEWAEGTPFNTQDNNELNEWIKYVIDQIIFKRIHWWYWVQNDWFFGSTKSMLVHFKRFLTCYCCICNALSLLRSCNCFISFFYYFDWNIVCQLVKFIEP